MMFSLCSAPVAPFTEAVIMATKMKLYLWKWISLAPTDGKLLPVYVDADDITQCIHEVLSFGNNSDCVY